MMGRMDDLIAFLRARLDEDEQTAQAAGGKPWTDEDGFADADPWFELPAELANHALRHDPARVLRATEGLHGLLHRYEEPETSPDLPDSVNRLTAAMERQVFDVVLPYLTLQYADHPDYRPEWRP